MDSRKTEAEISRAFKNFKERVLNEYSPENFILFGSRARGDNFLYSDFDFLIVSKKFEGVSWLDRISDVVRHWTAIVDIEVIPYTPQEFRVKKSASIIKDALKQGLQLA